MIHDIKLVKVNRGLTKHIYMQEDKFWLLQIHSQCNGIDECKMLVAKSQMTIQCIRTAPLHPHNVKHACTHTHRKH